MERGAEIEKMCLLYRSDIENAVAEAAKCDGGMANVGLVGEHDLENGDVANDRGRNGCDQEKKCGDEDEGHSDPGLIGQCQLRRSTEFASFSFIPMEKSSHRDLVAFAIRVALKSKLSADVESPRP